jgi:16S rRNA (uracil1498-N3)-methyltransferase
LADAKISTSKREVIVEIHAVRHAPRPRTRLTMFQAIGKSDKVDRVVRGAAELGISRFVPVSTARSVAEREHRRDRWVSIAEDSARVSGRAFLMEIDPITTLEAVATRPRAAVSICFSGDAPTRLSALDLRRDSVELLVGPEGGLEPRELELLVENGFVPVGLGPHTLRTETAGVATAAIVTFLAGGLDEEL